MSDLDLAEGNPLLLADSGLLLKLKDWMKENSIESVIIYLEHTETMDKLRVRTRKSSDSVIAL